MYVKTVSPVWVQQLHFVKEDIREKLNQLSGKSPVKEIRFLVGYTPSRLKEDDDVAPVKKAVLKKRDREMIAGCTESLADQELAAILRRVMQKEISRRRQRESAKAR